MSQTLVELPQSDDAEKSVLGAILVDNRHLAEIGDVLGTDDFYRPAHQAVFQAMVEMDNRGRPIDVLTLAEELKERGQLETIGGPMYVSQLMDGIPHLINVKHYAGIVRDHSIRRQLVKAASEVLNQAATTDGNVEEVLDKAEQGILAIGEKRAAAGFTSINELLAQSLDLIEERQKSDSHITGIPTGFDDFDDMTSGLQRGDLIVVAARPSMGKTALALTAAQNAAVRFGAKVAVFSLEMSSVQLALRMLFSEARVDMQKMRRGNLSDHHWNKLIKAYKRLDSAPIYLDDTAGSTVMAMRSKARRLKAEVGLDLIVVDYLQLMSGGGGKSENRQQEISAISRGLKEMGRELDVPVMALSQLSRAPDQRTGDHRPQLSDLRESGAIEQDADVVGFIFREEVYLRREGKDPGDKEGLAEVIVAKQRNGPVDTVRLAFIKEWTRFENLERGRGGGGFAPPPPDSGPAPPGPPPADDFGAGPGPVPVPDLPDGGGDDHAPF